LLASLASCQETIYRDLRTLWTDTIRKNPDCWMAHNNLGMESLDEKDLEEAEEHFKSALRIHPRLAKTHFNLGLVFQQTDRLDDAIRHFEISREIDLLEDKPEIHPRLAKTHYKLGQIAAQRGQWQQARDCFSRMLELDSTLWFGHSDLARVFTAEGKPEKAIEHLSEAIRLQPRAPEPHHQLGIVFSSQGRMMDAVNRFQRAVDLQPGNSLYRFSLGIAHHRQGKMARANREYQAAMNQDPRWPLAASRAAWTLATHPNPRLRDGPVAVHLADLACQATYERRPPRFLDVLAAAYAEDGQFDRAVAVAQVGLKAAEAARDERLAEEIARRITGYKARRPFRDPSVQ
jgi:tetratricopeptide (TPR) repeat protein